MNNLVISNAQTSESPQGLPFETIQHIADYIKSRIDSKPKVGIICGTGLGGLAGKIEKPQILSYEDIPHFPKPTVEGHAGRLVAGHLDGTPVLCFQGRFHFYEGHPIWKCGIFARVMKLLGIDNMVVSNAAGSLHPEYKVGDIMVLKDHINFHGFGGDTPLRGINEDRFGPRFLLMACAYDKILREKAIKLWKSQPFQRNLHEGVYVMLSGPSFETPAELKALKTLGVDAVGMSTIPEVITARHCSMRVFAFSLITNVCVTEQNKDEEDHIDPLAVGSKSTSDCSALVSVIAKEMVKE